MKKQIIIPLALTLMCSCGGSNTGKVTETKQNTSETPQNIKKMPLKMSGDFNQITSLGGIDIIYSQGDYNCTIEGDSIALSQVKADVESGILTLYAQTDNNPDINCYGTSQNIKAYISAPFLKCVAICAAGNFSSVGKWKAESLELGVIGTGSFDLDTIECNTFKYEATGEGNATIKHINSKESIMFTCMSKSDVNANINTNQVTAVTQSGKITLTGTAKQKDLSATNKALIEDKTVRK